MGGLQHQTVQTGPRQAVDPYCHGAVTIGDDLSTYLQRSDGAFQVHGGKPVAIGGDVSSRDDSSDMPGGLHAQGDRRQRYQGALDEAFTCGAGGGQASFDGQFGQFRLTCTPTEPSPRVVMESKRPRSGSRRTR